jgi:diguanylate cyclase (GGDEF)-like protein/PAS domain S-box-containing protein
MKNTPNVRYIIFSKINGETLTITTDKWTLDTESTQPTTQANAVTKSNVFSNSLEGKLTNLLVPQHEFEFSRDIIIGGKAWGTMTVLFSKEAYSDVVQSFYWTVIGVTIASSLLSCLLFLLSSRKIRSQIGAFEKVAITLAEGNLLVHAPENAVGEISILGKAINRMSSALQEKSERIAELAKIVEQTKDGFVMFDTTEHVAFANPAFETITGHSAVAVVGTSLSVFDDLLGLAGKLQASSWDISEYATKQDQDFIVRCKNGSPIDVEIRFEKICDSFGQLQYKLMVLSDIRERKLVETELRIAATAFESQEGILVTDDKEHILKVNRAFTEVTGYTLEEVLGHSPKLLSSGRHDAAFFGLMWESIKCSGAWEGEVWNRRKNGEIYPQRLTITEVKDKQGNVSHYVGTFTDITTHKKAEEQIRNLAFFDPLTSLPNRRLLMDRLSHALSSSHRANRVGALLFIDLDNFKTLNDTLGHDMGDELLKLVAERLCASVREADTVARLGGDEFVVILEGLDESDVDAAAQTEKIANKILATINQPYQLGSHEYRNTSSIGATLFGQQSCFLDELLKQADIAMYQAKRAGRNSLRFFNPRMQEAINTRAQFESELRQALDKQQFQLFYQTQIDSDYRVFGAEALIRWNHPTQGTITPTKFISVAEETKLIIPIGQWVLDSACAQLATWQHNPITSQLILSINVSPRQLRATDFIDLVLSSVQHYSIKPQRLMLELTENVLLENIEETIASMQTLSRFGIQFALDDFGTGYSSLQYLKRLPLHQLKIDRSFVDEIAVDINDQSIVHTIVAMAHNLNLSVIAEGVESQEQRALLLESGCTQFQGYLFGQPLPIEQFEQQLLILEKTTPQLSNSRTTLRKAG